MPAMYDASTMALGVVALGYHPAAEALGALAAERARAGAPAAASRQGPAVPALPAEPQDHAHGALDEADEGALIDGAQDGSEEAFRVLVERYRKRAYWLAYQLVHDEEDAHDIAQEAFIRVFRSIDRFDRRYKFYTWLYKIVTNLAVDQLRKRGDRRRVSIDAVGEIGARGAPIGRAMEDAELSERVQRVLDKLPPKYKAVMVLRELQGIDAKEIAGIVGSTHATVRWRLHRARSLFREEWESLYGEPPAP